MSTYLMIERSRGRLAAALFSSILVMVGLAPRATEAQVGRWELDVSGSRIEYDSVAPLNAPSLGALGEWRSPSSFGRLSGSATGFEGSGWSGQVRGDLAGWVSPFGVQQPVRLELAGTAGGSRHSSGFNSRVGRADARLHLRNRSAGGWAGVSLAAARNSFDTAAVHGVIPSGGLWAQNGSVRATLTVLGTRLLGETYPEANLALSVTRGPLDLTLYGGHRQFPSDFLESSESWAGATAAVWITPTVGVVASGGQYASDVLQGLPSGRFFSVGLRITGRRSRPIPLRASAPIVYTPDDVRSGAIGFEVAGATRVEVAGDWTEWRLVPLTRASDGRWLLPASLDGGVYRFNLRVDGERWIVPDGVAEIDDGFGGRVGLLIVSN